MSSENCTYFNSVNVMTGGCQATICPCNDNICQVEKVQHVKLQNRHVLHVLFALPQLRLDFQSFSITGPTTNTVTVTKRLAKTGVVTNTGTVGLSEFTQCLTDTFSVSNSDGPNPPAICGVNTGEHSKQIFF